MTSRPAESEYAPYYARYVSLVPESDPLTVLETQAAEIERVAGAIDPGREVFRYADGKWSIREVFGHLLDGERVFGYRLFCISRGEAAALPSFDPDSYAAAGRYDARSLADIVAELSAVRAANLMVLRRLTDQDWLRTGTASGHPVTVRAVAFILAGHVRHHLNVLHRSYGA